MHNSLSQPLISRVLTSELVELQQISRETFFETFAGFNTPEDMQRYMEHNLGAEQLSREIENPDSRFFFARVNGAIAGYLKLNTGTACTDSRYAEALEIERIYVRKEFKGTGGRAGTDGKSQRIYARTGSPVALAGRLGKK